MRTLYILLTTFAMLIALAQIANPDELSVQAQIKALDARVTLLEDWAIRRGGKLR
jgi:hypothetical protein